MANDPVATPPSGLDPDMPLPPGPLLRIADGALVVEIAPSAGGRIAQVHCDGIAQLLGHGEHGATGAIAWGSYPMVPWCGRVRDGAFVFDGVRHQLPVDADGHALHGLGFLLPWRVSEHSTRHVAMELALPRDARWPFGGLARQRIEVQGRRLAMTLSMTATDRAMPVALGWHPWLRKPDRLEFRPESMYPRDARGIAVLPPGEVRPGPWDDCFVNREEVVACRAGQRLRMTSDCRDWVIYDVPDFATCVEPQSAPPDSFNLRPELALQPGDTMTVRFSMAWD